MTALIEDQESICLEDKRYGLRQKSSVPFLMVEHPSSGLVQARVADISRHGLRLQMPVALPCGDEIIIHPPQNTGLLRLRAHIIRQRVMYIDEEKWIECGIQAADTAEWRKHKWFLALRSPEQE